MSNVGDYIAAGRTVSGAAGDIFSTARKYGPDYSGLGKAALEARSQEKISAMKAEEAVAKSGLKAAGNVKSTQLTSDARVKQTDIIADAKLYTHKKDVKTRMAGKIAAVGAASAAAFTASKGKRPRAPASVDYSSLIAEQQAKVDASNAKLLELSKKSTTTQPVDNTKAPTYSLSADEKAALDAIGQWESDGVGSYDAINQIGIDGGRAVLPGSYSGDIRKMSQHKGRSLTDFTIGEIMDLQSKNNMSNQQWIDAGRLHAVGRYQFIGDTFASQVQRQGLSRDTKFTPQVQDRMALTYLREVGGISPWVGPSDHATPEQRAVIARVAKSKPSWMQPVTKTGVGTAPFGHQPIEYLTGDRNHSGFRADHGGANYHDHLAFKTTKARDAAMARLRQHGIKIGSINDGKHADTSYHYADLAFDVPGTNWEVGKEAEGSQKIRTLLNF